MSESLLVTYCAPTLAGLKTGNLFNCTCTGRRQAEETVRQWNRTLNSKGVYAVIMRCREGRVLIFVYRRAKLLHDFSGTEVRRFLKKFGYEGKNLQEMLEQLSQRLCASDSFPHEIGLFLGYPIEDVKDFIKNEGRNCKLAGTWKVYHDEQNARKTFCKFKKCTDIYCQMLGKGTPLRRLTVAG